MAAINGWSLMPLGSFCKLKGGKRLPKGEGFATTKTAHPYIRVTDFGNFGVELARLKYLHADTHAAISRYIIRKSDIYISIAGTTGVVGMVPEELDGANLTENAARIVIDNTNAILPRFIMFFLASKPAQDYLKSQTVKNAQPKLALVRIQSIPVPIPPVNEQRRIAAVLSAVQRAIERQERLIALTAELKKALMHKLFTEGTRGEPLKQTEIGPVPESWVVAPLAKFAESFQYGTSVKCGYEGKGLPVLRIPNVVGGHLDVTDLKFGNPKKNELETARLRSGDLLFVRTNGVRENAGRCSMYRGELGDSCYFASYLIRARLRDGLMPEFLEEYTRTEIGVRLLAGRAIRTADGKFNINTGTLETLLVPKPDIDEQKAIANVLALIDKKACNHVATKAALESLFRTLLHQLMTAQIRLHDLDLTALGVDSGEAELQEVA
jgi:type I restriction enzyme S subunit